jgi:hypothetical protein
VDPPAVDGGRRLLEAAIPLKRGGSGMEFVQTIELTTTKYDELRAVGDEFVEKRRTAGGPKPTSVVHLRDRDNPNTYRIVAWFASAEEAMENSNREDTTQMAERMAALCDERTFRNFDVVYQINL